MRFAGIGVGHSYPVTMEDELRGEDSDPSGSSNEDDTAALLDIDGDIDEVDPDVDDESEPDITDDIEGIHANEQIPAVQEEPSIYDSLGITLGPEDGEGGWAEFEDEDDFGLL